MSNLKGTSLLSLLEYDREQIEYLIDKAIFLKEQKAKRIFERRLLGRNIGLVFLKPSCRTRLSFVTAAVDEGAHAENFPTQDIRFGIKESVRDIARVFGRLFDGLAFRGFGQEQVEVLARYAGIPVWNGLSDSFHPTQILADLMTFKEQFGTISKLKVAFVGDGRNNMVNSFIVAAAKVQLDFRIVAPRSLHPSREIVTKISRATGVNLSKYVRMFEDPKKGLQGCDVVYGDTWVSMGEEHMADERIRVLRPYKVTPAFMKATGNSKAIYLHCLPALHDGSTEFEREHPGAADVSEEVFEGKASRVFDQAENRMHTIKALMRATIVGD